MANIHFRPNKGKKVVDTSIPQVIYLRYKLGRTIDFNASIGFKVLLDNWDYDKQQVKNRSIVTDRQEINNLIKNLTDHFYKFELRNREKGITPNYKEVKQYFDSFYTISEDKKEKDLFAFIDEFIEDAKTKPNPITHKLVTKATLRGYTLTKNFLVRFHKEQYPINFETINLEWYYDFVEWANSQNLTTNYIGKHIKTVKTFMSSAVEVGLTANESFKSKKFIVSKEESDSVYLNEKELKAIWNLNLSKEPRKEIARDLFLIGAYTGLRVSDYNNINKHNIKVINGVKMISIVNQKTNRKVSIPVHPIVEMILEKYDGNTPPKIPDSDINEHIKFVCESAEIDDVEYIEQTRGGKKVQLKKYKFELVKTHTARRSFCTNAYLGGVSTLDIMSISGHTTESSFMKYIKVSSEQFATKMSKHEFFKGNTNLKVV
jgi:integrase